MTTNRDIENFCREYLQVTDYEDYCYNGLQIEGREKVEKIVTGVTYSQKFIKKAIEKKADMMLVHHGIFMLAVGRLPSFSGHLKKRMKLTFENDINLMGFHLPLDAHPEIGNNVAICKKLEIYNLEKLSVGFVGDLKEEMEFNIFKKTVDDKLETSSYALLSGPQKVKRIGVVSGGSSPDFLEAKKMGADTFIAGDLRENVVREAEEENINIINAGHYNSERLGIQNLGKLLAEKFDLEHDFIDIPNEI